MLLYIILAQNHTRYDVFSKERPSSCYLSLFLLLSFVKTTSVSSYNNWNCVDKLFKLINCKSLSLTALRQSLVIINTQKRGAWICILIHNIRHKTTYILNLHELHKDCIILLDRTLVPLWIVTDSCTMHPCYKCFGSQECEMEFLLWECRVQDYPPEYYIETQWAPPAFALSETHCSVANCLHFSLCKYIR